MLAEQADKRIANANKTPFKPTHLNQREYDELHFEGIVEHDANIDVDNDLPFVA